MLDGPNFRIELVSRGAPGARVDRTPPSRHLDVLGYKAIGLHADDLPATTEAMRAGGVEIVWAD